MKKWGQKLPHFGTPRVKLQVITVCIRRRGNFGWLYSIVISLYLLLNSKLFVFIFSLKNNLVVEIPKYEGKTSLDRIDVQLRFTIVPLGIKSDWVKFRYINENGNLIIK